MLPQGPAQPAAVHRSAINEKFERRRRRCPRQCLLIERGNTSYSCCHSQVRWTGRVERPASVFAD
jgi:hypothetical protein